MAENIDPTSPLAGLKPELLDTVRLVAQHRTSKEIAVDLGISPHTVDMRLKQVQKILSLPSRAEAARLYDAATAKAPQPPTAEHGELLYQSPELLHQSPELPQPPRIGDENASSGEPNRSVDRSATTLHQPQSAYMAGVAWQSSRPWYSVLLEASRTNDLTPLARTLCIGATMFVIVASLILIVIMAEFLSRTL